MIICDPAVRSALRDMLTVWEPNVAVLGRNELEWARANVVEEASLERAVTTA